MVDPLATIRSFVAAYGAGDVEGRIVEIRMVDARPAYSDEFWSD